MNINDFENLENRILGLPIPASSKNVKLARDFVWDKWQEYKAELGEPPPKDLTDSCKFTSQFARIIFGGELRGNKDHQFIRLDDGRILDLNRYADDVQHKIAEPHKHDPSFFGNPEHEKSMETCRGTVCKWIEDFLALLKKNHAIEESQRRAYIRRMNEEVEEEYNAPGQFVGVKFAPRTVQRLVEWSKANMTGDSIQPPDGYHTTVILSRSRKFPYDPTRWNPPLVIPASTLEFAIFGHADPVLVVKYDCPELEQRHWKARVENNLTWDFPEYIPHVTLSDHELPWKGRIEDLSPIQFDLEITTEYVTDFE